MIGSLEHLLHFLFNVKGLIEWGGTLLVCVIVFIETGFFVGFFLPGDSLLVTAGVFAASGQLQIAKLVLLVPLCAIVGDQIGYWIGRKAGEALYRREDSLVFRKRHLESAHHFYEKYGGKTVILARFVPIIRTFCPPVAGAAQMPYGRYFAYDIAGGILWGGGMVLGGYFLGRQIPNISENIHYVIAVVIFLSLLPPIIGMLRARSSGSRGPSSVPQPAPHERD
jgi:membrane-associated protein